MDFWNSSQRMDFRNMDPQMNSVPQTRSNNKIYFSSPGDFNMNGQLPQCFPGNTWPDFPQNTMNNIGQNVGNFMPSSSFSYFGNYPMGNFFGQPHVAVPNSSHPQPFKAHLGNNVTNPFSVSNLQTRPVISEETAGSSAEQPSTSSSAPSPRHMDTVPIYQAQYVSQD